MGLRGNSSRPGEARFHRKDTGLCPNLYILQRDPNVNNGTVIAPPPPVRRPRPLPTEPIVFAVALTLLTLAINLQPQTVRASAAKAPAPTTQVAAAR